MNRSARRPQGIEAAEETRLHRRAWAVQRLAWTVLAVLLAAALLGLFGGGGPLSRSQARSADGALEVRYERFARREAPADLEIHAAPRGAASGELHVHISRKYLEGVRVDRITPAPVRVEAGHEDVTYVFAARSPTAFTFRLQLQTAGRLQGQITLEPDSSVRFSQLVYP
ncbi:MAG TPA: hypothetical protein VF203_03445 [Burkholderiales bacterium]